MKNNYISIFDYKLLNNKYKIFSIIFIIFIILIFSIGIIVSSKINYYHYSEFVGIYNDEKISLLVNVNELDKITNNKKLIINKKTYKYKVSIKEELNINNIIYKEVILNINYKNINNNNIKFMIITKSENLLKYVKNSLIGGNV